MKKKTIIQVLLFLIFLSGGYQNASAKKIVYLGHEYNGKVNDQNIPEGEGKIDIGGLIVKGVFAGKTINDATFSTEWLSYNGTVTYDRDMKIVLKQGGKFTKYYYLRGDITIVEFNTGPRVNTNSLAGKKRSAIEVIPEDYVVDNESLLKEKLKMPLSFKMEDVPSELNPPNVSTTSNFSLNRLDTGNSLTDYMYLYVVPSEVAKWVDKYEDKQGRIWYYREAGLLKDKFGKGRPTYYTVIYPNYSQYVSDGSWSVHCSDKFSHVYDGNHKVLLEDHNILIKNFKGGTELNDFLRYVEAGKTDIVLPIGTEILLQYDDRNKSAEEIESMITEVLSYYQLEKPFGAKVYYKSGIDEDYKTYPDHQLGIYENGHYIPKKK